MVKGKLHSIVARFDADSYFNQPEIWSVSRWQYASHFTAITASSTSINWKSFQLITVISNYSSCPNDGVICHLSWWYSPSYIMAKSSSKYTQIPFIPIVIQAFHEWTVKLSIQSISSTINNLTIRLSNLKSRPWCSNIHHWLLIISVTSYW